MSTCAVIDAPSRHGSSRNLVRVFLDANLLPIVELGLLYGQLPRIPVVACQVGTYVRFRVFELLLDIADGGAALLADVGPKDELLVGLRKYE